MYDQPVVQLLCALYGHPDAGTFCEQHDGDVIVKRTGSDHVKTWQPCYCHSKWQLLLIVYVGDFKMSGPEKCMDVAWKALPQYIEMEEPAEATL